MFLIEKGRISVIYIYDARSIKIFWIGEGELLNLEP